jgi:hypothetical protein
MSTFNTQCTTSAKYRVKVTDSAACTAEGELVDEFVKKEGAVEKMPEQHRIRRKNAKESSKSPTRAATATCDVPTINTAMEGSDIVGQAIKPNFSHNRAQLSVDSDDEHPDPEALAQFLGSKTDFTTPFSIQRETLWQEKTRLSRVLHSF